MASSVIEKNLIRLQKRTSEVIDYRDLDYRGKSKDVYDIFINRGTPVLNAYKMWLQSKSSDYIRNQNFGGFLRETIYRFPITVESEEEIKKIIKSETDQKFPNINILRLDVEGIPKSKSWKVKVAVQDELTKMVSYDMYPLKQSIVMDAQK